MFSSFFVTTLFLVAFLTLSITSVAHIPNPDMEKKSSFECGFNNITKNKTSFSTKFFLVMILFLVFDLEIAILLPSCMSQSSTINPMMMALIFIMFLTIIMVIEWVNGIIEWSI